MTNDENAFLTAIREHPNDDTSRLVYADWLDEHDRPERAQYIRLNIQLANLHYGDPNFDAEEQRLKEEISPLFDKIHEKWEAELVKQLPGAGDLYFHTERGMFSGVCCSVKFFLDNGDRIFRLAPIQKFMPASLSATTAKRLVAHPQFRRLKELRVANKRNAPALLECPSVEIESLSFYQFLFFSEGEWDDFATRFAASAAFKSIKRINFENCGLGDTGGQAFANSPHLNPEVLNLLTNSFTAPVRKALRKRYGSRVWIDPADRNGTPRGTR